MYVFTYIRRKLLEGFSLKTAAESTYSFPLLAAMHCCVAHAGIGVCWAFEYAIPLVMRSPPRRQLCSESYCNVLAVAFRVQRCGAVGIGETGSHRRSDRQADGDDHGVHQGELRGDHHPRDARLRWQPEKGGKHDQAGTWVSTYVSLVRFLILNTYPPVGKGCNRRPPSHEYWM